jgi:hypothetical protein
VPQCIQKLPSWCEDKWAWTIFEPHSKCCRNLEQRPRMQRQFSRKQHFIVPAQTQWLSPGNKGGLPYIPLKADYRSKKQSLTYMWLHVTLSATSLPQRYVTFFTFRFFKFYLSAMPFLPPCYIIRTQTCLLLCWPSSLLQ